MCALWHFRLGDRALDPWACGRRTARGQSWSPVLADGEARRRFLFWTWRSAVAAATAARSFWPEGGLRILPSDMARALNGRISAERPLLEVCSERGARSLCSLRSSARARGPPLGQRFRSGRRGAMGTLRREPIETADRGVAVACVRSGISGWVIGLLIRGRAGAERRAANSGRRCWPTARPAAVFCFGLGDRRWRPATAARSFWPEGGLRILPSDMARALNGRISAERPLLEVCSERGARYPMLFALLPRAREGHPSASGFDPGRGAELWGLFGASRSKPLAEGWLWRVCALAFQAG